MTGSEERGWVPMVLICLPFSRDTSPPGRPAFHPQFSPGSDMAPSCPFLLWAGNRFSLLPVSGASPFFGGSLSPLTPL